MDTMKTIINKYTENNSTLNERNNKLGIIINDKNREISAICNSLKDFIADKEISNLLKENLC